MAGAPTTVDLIDPNDLTQPSIVKIFVPDPSFSEAGKRPLAKAINVLASSSRPYGTTASAVVAIALADAVAKPGGFWALRIGYFQTKENFAD